MIGPFVRLERVLGVPGGTYMLVTRTVARVDEQADLGEAAANGPS